MKRPIKRWLCVSRILVAIQGKEIRLARKGLGYTQKSLAEKTQVNKTTISEIENGRFTGSFDIFERVLDGVGLQFELNKKKI